MQDNMEGTRAMWVVKAVRVPIYDHLHLEIILSNDTSRVAKYANIPAEEVGIYSGLVFKREARRRSSVCIYPGDGQVYAYTCIRTVLICLRLTQLPMKFFMRRTIFLNRSGPSLIHRMMSRRRIWLVG